MTFIVTGAAGFIGSNIVKALNARGHHDILAVDNLTHADKFKNLVDCSIQDYIDKTDLHTYLQQNRMPIAAIFHQGACSDTMATDGRYVMSNNYHYTQTLYEFAIAHQIPFLYASSAAVYGGSKVFVEARQYERPLNVYGYSKFLFDQYLRQSLVTRKQAPRVAGFRYFNVYGQGEQHKGRMASVAYHHFHQFRDKNSVALFEGCDGYANGAQQRDFVFIDDVVKVNLHFADLFIKDDKSSALSGIYNLGTGRAQTFNDIALSTVNTVRTRHQLAALPLDQLLAQDLLRYVQFPDALKGKYQSHTQADIGRLRAAGYTAPFATVEEGVAQYVNYLADHS